MTGVSATSRISYCFVSYYTKLNPLISVTRENMVSFRRGFFFQH